ncbi:hypothetical protein ACVWYG_001057 [Pedobacter sp. UYEF25]
MNKETENNEWIDLAPYLAKTSRRNPFITPSHYFEGLEEQTKNAIFLAGLSGNKQHFGLQIPDDYFKTLSSKIETNITLIQNIKQESAFTVPENYFSQLQDRIVARTIDDKVKKAPKILKLLQRDLVKYATAACLLLVSSFGLYFYSRHSLPTIENSAQIEGISDQFLYDIDESTIIQHLDTEKMAKGKAVSTTDAEMENYLLNHYTTGELAQDL